MGQLPPPAGPGGRRSNHSPGGARRAGVPVASGGPPLHPAFEAGDRRRWRYAIPIALVVYLFLAFFTLFQPVKVAGQSLSVPIPGLSTERIFGLPDRPFTVAVIGLDIRPTQSGPSRTDSIILVRVDSGRNRVGVLSVPRDSMMEIAQDDGSYYQDRVNTAYVYNWSSKDKTKAPEALVATLKHNLGIKVDYYIVFDQRGAEKMIDAAGGVSVKVRQAFGQDDYSDDDVHVVPQYFPAGWRHLNGYQAVAYGRIREGSSDFDRILRQQQVAEGLVDGLSSPLSLRRLPGLWSAYDSSVQTNLSMRQTAGLLALLKDIGTDRMVTRSLGDAAVSCGYCEAALLLLEPDKTAQLINEAFGDASAGQQAARLLVQAGVTP